MNHSQNGADTAMIIKLVEGQARMEGKFDSFTATVADQAKDIRDLKSELGAVQTAIYTEINELRSDVSNLSVGQAEMRAKSMMVVMFTSLLISVAGLAIAYLSLWS